MDAVKLGIKIDNDQWEVCAHRHTPAGTEPDFTEKSKWNWYPVSLPFDAISWLHSAGFGPDPLLEQNDLQYQWVEDVDWVLRREVWISSEAFSLEDELHLLVNGIDCYCDVYFNGSRIGKCRNQFREYSFDLDEFNTDSPNELIFYIRSARNVNAVLESAYGSLPASFDTGRVHARRCQSLTGWNMASRLSSVSVVQAPEISASAAIELSHAYAFIRQLPGVKPGQATVDSALVQVNVNLLSRRRGNGELLVEIIDLETGEVVAEKREPLSIKPRAARLSTSLTVPEARLWWSASLGDQPLYKVQLSITAQDRMGASFTSEATTRLGIRTLSIDRRKDDEGESFVPMLNGTPVFCRGANWLPLTLLPATAKVENYRSLIATALGAGMNCLRVWGGGIYETDEFYNLCDQAGLLVWQDFMFASAAYPTYREFLDEVEAEASYQVVRLREHPCLMVWCGNNENEWLHQVGELRKGNEQRIIGDQIWSHLIREVVEDNDPARTYVQSSPFGKNRVDYNDMATGSRHSWEVWADWQPLDTQLRDTSRFVAEFGMQAFPVASTVYAIAPGAVAPDDLNLAHHQNMNEGNERLLRYVSAHLAVPSDLNGWIESSQTIQGLALTRAIEHWRRRRCLTAGCLIWHFNECYPGITWSLIDYYQRPKPALAAVARAFSPVHVSIELLIGGQPVMAIPPELWSVAGDNPSSNFPVEGGDGIRCEHLTSLIQYRVTVINDTLLQLNGELILEHDCGINSNPMPTPPGDLSDDSNPSPPENRETALPPLLQVSLEPNESSIVITDVILPECKQNIQQATLTARWILDEGSTDALAELQEKMVNVQTRIAGKDDAESGVVLPMDLTLGLSKTICFVEPKYFKK